MAQRAWVVHKFGGTSVAGSERYRRAWDIVCREPGRKKAVVVSAMSGVTDALLDCVALASRRDDAYRAKLDVLRTKHLQTIAELIPEPSRSELGKVVESDFQGLSEVLRGIWHGRFASEQSRELVSGHGELWSAQILCAYARSLGADCVWLDARDTLVVSPSATAVTVDWETSRAKTAAWLEAHPQPVVIITGFVASTPDGVATTLKRNGSDFSASIFGRLLDAASITIWTDVDGVLTADPRLVPDAVLLDELSYAEATELAYFGAKVVHPSTMMPAIHDRIPIWIRNSFRPEVKGTQIHADARPSPRSPARGFATIGKLALGSVEGTGMVGVPGIAERLFGALRERGISVILISQASSEHSICFAIPESHAKEAVDAANQAFYAEIAQGYIQTVSATSGCAVLAIVGDGMVSRPGVSATFLSALGQAGINVKAIAQGSSERNISVVVDAAESARALRAAHSAFYLSPQTLSVGLVGCGRVGTAFLRQLAGEQARLRRESNVDLRVRGVLTTKSLWLGDPELDLAAWADRPPAGAQPAEVGRFLSHVRADHLPHAVVIDFTASDDVARRYPEWMERGLHVITPNKKASAAGTERYEALREAIRRTGRRYLHETTVGGGLPLLRTLADLVRTGDRVRRIEGVLSGTLSFLFNRFDGTRPFSELVADAHAQGLTEPDPRDDLGGLDVARKLVILARQAGLAVDPTTVAIESLVPAGLTGTSVEEFFRELPKHDGDFKRRLDAARARDHVLRFAAVLEGDGKASVGLREFPRTHPIARLAETDNLVAFTTDRYRHQPLVIQGPGAGPEVTAAGVFADLLRLVTYLGGNT